MRVAMYIRLRALAVGTMSDFATRCPVASLFELSFWTASILDNNSIFRRPYNFHITSFDPFICLSDPI